MVQSSTGSRSKFSGPIVVGKDVLELLTSAMYADPLSIYREYVQNAADSIDEATQAGLYAGRTPPPIEITINQLDRSVTIRDKGAGISKHWFKRTLSSIGASKKRGKSARGFRGVGRLAGLGFCQELIMRTRSADDDNVCEMHWDCKRLKELLRDPADLSLEQILAEVVNTEIFVSAKYPKHFFEVEMKSVTRYKSDLFLNVSALEDYLCQVAPVPFSSSFSFGAEIQDFLDKHAPNNTYSITLNGKPMFRPFRDSYELKPKLNGRFSKPEFFTIPANSAEVEAVGWILPSDYLGAIPERYGMHGFRLRVGNIQVGDARILDALFPQPRFNAWAVAECHVISPKIVPNARRDDFEHNNSYATLRNHLTPIAKAVLKACRQRSAERAKTRKLAAQRNNVNGHSLDWAQTRKFFLKNAKLRVSKRHTTALLKQLRNGGLTYSELIRSLIEPSNSHQIKHE